MLNLKELVTQRQAESPGRFCVGLDPDPEKIPTSIQGPSDGIRAAVHMMGIVDATQESAAVFKPQRAYWEALNDGITGLRTVIAYIHTRYPRIPAFLDCKRGDIDRTQFMYGKAHLGLDEADGMNLNPYMGKDCLEQLVKADTSSGLASIITLGRTSNSAAWEIQDAKLANGDRVWEHCLRRAVGWAKECGIFTPGQFGVVMGAAHDAELLKQNDGTVAEQSPEETEKGPGGELIYTGHLWRARQITGDTTLYLIPGIGKQGGFTEATLRAAWRGPGTVIINQSSGMSQASLGNDWQSAAEAAARKQCEKNAAVIATLPK